MGKEHALGTMMGADHKNTPPYMWVPVSTSLALILAPAVVTSAGFTTAGSQLLYDGNPVILKGLVITCTEYLLKQITTPCIAMYNSHNASSIISTLDTNEIDAVLANFDNPPSGTMGAVRICLNAAYYLNVVTSAWSSAYSQYPGLSAQYVALINEAVTYITGKGVVVILDLHWNDDVTQQQPMALRASGTSQSTGDSVAFWDSIASKYSTNPLVFYELYNEPHTDLATFLNGSADGGPYEGVFPMLAAVSQHNPRGLVLIGGAQDYAYDSASLVYMSPYLSQYSNIAWVIHPYMGTYQKGDTAKGIPGVETMLSTLLATKRPVIATEYGQYCCPDVGACFQFDGTYNGQAAGYVEVLHVLFQAHAVSSTAWAWRPGTGGQCSQPDVSANDELFAGTGATGSGSSGGGVDWLARFPAFFGLANSPTTPGPTAKPVSQAPTSKPTTGTPTTPGPTARPAPTTTGAPVAAPTAQPASSCSALYAQCGGQGWAGPFTCCVGVCTYGNEYYYQCLPATTTANPAVNPAAAPSAKPFTTSMPSNRPTGMPTSKPSGVPTNKPTDVPTNKPITTGAPTNKPVTTTMPTSRPTTANPTKVPTKKPTTRPSVRPSLAPSTSKPSHLPTTRPTTRPTRLPTARPTIRPTHEPTARPSLSPTKSKPTQSPSSHKPTLHA